MNLEKSVLLNSWEEILDRNQVFENQLKIIKILEETNQRLNSIECALRVNEPQPPKDSDIKVILKNATFFPFRNSKHFEYSRIRNMKIRKNEICNFMPDPPK
jgi:hypothetical protein